MLDNEDAGKSLLEKFTSFKNKDGEVVMGVNSVNNRKFSDKWALKAWGGMKPNGKDRERYESLVMEVGNEFKLWEEQP